MLQKQETLKSSEAKKEKTSKTLKLTFGIIFIVIFLVVISVSIAYIADFARFYGTNKNGLLWTAQQRAQGIFGIFNRQ
ncbi:hypothetical protein E1I18_02680 [Mycoplasmopsis mucosicanis]|uniref:Uncharacterized protein n=1 Tax=Mycoplasmopsis mucosicanis TaxID=458208 RepID=A0A507SJK0_9BACT|nr:hypothetical protein [Mycoplasmopsis mucosicanis]TQC51401.1 hypothetical protein E1I18_02680 [Mycoplasmopsis mucosicanis]